MDRLHIFLGMDGLGLNVHPCLATDSRRGLWLSALQYCSTFIGRLS